MEEVTRETRALREAIACVEAEFAAADDHHAPGQHDMSKTSALPDDHEAEAYRASSTAGDDARRPPADRSMKKRRRSFSRWAVAALAVPAAIVATSWSLSGRGRLAREGVETVSDSAMVPDPISAHDSSSSEDATIPRERAALLVDAPVEPSKIKTYVGTVRWRLDHVDLGHLPLAVVVKADLDIPDAKLTVVMLLRRNREPTFPTSHTIEFRFLPWPGYGLGTIKQIGLPEMREDDQPTGRALEGAVAAVTGGDFLVGLSRGVAEAVDEDLLANRNWFDLPLLLQTGLRAKLTFEKGTDGRRIWADAVRSWR